jgi:gamma-glutamyl-gamma-aminobutyraldehyde dehydrogenase
MSDLLTHAEYQALAADLNPPRSPFIDGKYHTGRGAMMTTTNPATRCGDCRDHFSECG